MFVALVIAAAGCGGGSSTSSGELSASQFQAKANAICSDHKANTRHMTSTHDFNNQLAQAAKLAPQAALHVRKSEVAARAAGLEACVEV